MQRKNKKKNSNKVYGTIVKLSGKRIEPFGVRLTIGYDQKGYPVYEFLDTFNSILSAELCRMNYSQNPYNLIISHEKYEKIIKFTKLPSDVIDETTIIKEEDKTGYTFSQVYNEWAEIYLPTKEEIQREKQYGVKSRGKLSWSNAALLKTAYNNSKILHNKIYSRLRTIDFETTISSMENKRSTLYCMRNLYVKLDGYSYQKNIIDKKYADEINIECEENITSRHPYTYNEIDFLWSMKGNQDVDILLILLYSCMRIEELLKMEISNIHLKEDYMLGGIKTQNGKNRIIPIHSKIKHIIKSYYNKNKDMKYLFVDAYGNKINYQTYHKRFSDMKKEWGQNNFNQTHVIHETRHSGESELDRKGANKRCRDLIMGHKSKDVGDRIYNHKTIGELKETIELISYEKAKIISLSEAQ